MPVIQVKPYSYFKQQEENVVFNLIHNSGN